WHILAVHNTDGYEFSHQNGNRFWRKNRNNKLDSDCVGVDLNRNHGYKWDADGFENDNFGQFVSDSNKNITESHRLDLKRVAQDGVKNMKKVNNQTFSINEIVTEKAIEDLTLGSSEDWAQSIRIKYTYLIELRDSGRYGFLLPFNQISIKPFILTVSKAIFNDTKKGKFKLT
ncbi:carboxypeptidase B2-like, partial [Contarinia nasturtii]|uniref:carboxypeptidase B2-like n=1 Tax=Contarinia nasturtii TaxID=265458 RepID=UPI0012D3C75B